MPDAKQPPALSSPSAWSGTSLIDETSAHFHGKGDMLNATLDGTRLAALSLDMNGTITHANASFFDLVQRPATDVLGMSLVMLAPPALRQLVLATLPGLLDGSIDTFLLPLQHDVGPVTSWRFNVVPMPGCTGPAGCHCIAAMPLPAHSPPQDQPGLLFTHCPTPLWKLDISRAVAHVTDPARSTSASFFAPLDSVHLPAESIAECVAPFYADTHFHFHDASLIDETLAAVAEPPATYAASIASQRPPATGALPNGGTEGRSIEHHALVTRLASLVRISDANNAALELIEGTGADLSTPALFLRLGMDALMERLLSCIRSKTRKFTDEIIAYTLSGRPITLLVEGKLLSLHGHDLAILSTTDITARKRAELELVEARNLMQAMSDNMHDMLWAKDTESRYIFANRAVRETLLCSDDIDPIGKTDAFFAERQQQLGTEHTLASPCMNSDKGICDARASGRFIEDGLVRGKYMVLDVRKSPLYDTEGNLLGSVGTGRDITRQRAHEQALIRSQRLLALTAEASNDAIWEHDIPNKRFLCNRRCHACHGKKTGSAPFSECSCLAMTHPDDVGMLEALLNGRGCGQESFREEFRLGDADGNWRWMLCRGKVVERDGSGTPTLIVGTHTDISTLKETESRLHAARDEAEQANHAKDVFLANISHELRTPLNGVLSMLRLLEGTEPTPEQLELVRKAESSSRALLALINDIIEFTRFEYSPGQDS